MYIHIYVHMYAYIYMYIYMYRRIHRGPASGYTYRHLRIDMHIQTYTLIPRYIYLQVTAGLSHTRRASNMHMYTRRMYIYLHIWLNMYTNKLAQAWGETKRTFSCVRMHTHARTTLTHACTNTCIYDSFANSNTCMTLLPTQRAFLRNYTNLLQDFRAFCSGDLHGPSRGER